MYHPQHEPAEYDSAELRSIQSPGLLLHLLCQKNLTLLEGFRQSILPAWWEASAKLGGWSCTRIPISLEGKIHDAQLAGAVELQELLLESCENSSLLGLRRLISRRTEPSYCME
jgi:hypothetical protein